MAGGYPEHGSACGGQQPLASQAQGWNADYESGTLQGWGSAQQPASTLSGTAPSSVADVTAAAVMVQSGGDGSSRNAEELLARLLASGADSIGAVEGSGAAAGDENDDDDDDDAEVDAVDRAAQALQALLRDNAAFFEASEAAFNRTCSAGGAVVPNGGGMLRSAEELRQAFNAICKRCGIDEVEELEAEELYDGEMDLGVFYQFAREYFQSLARTLTMDV